MARQFVKYLGDKPIPKKKTTYEEDELPIEEPQQSIEDILVAKIPIINDTPMHNAVEFQTQQAPPEQHIQTIPQPVPLPKIQPQPIDNVMESVVVMLNQILQDMAAIMQKLDAKASMESFQPTIPTKRQIILKRDETGKIVGAEVVDESKG